MSTHPPDQSRARSFGGVVDAYDRGRPSYPRDGVQWLVGPVPGRVLELGAGTGKLTEQLVGLGHSVVATDPLEPMLRRLALRVPAARPVLGVAEEIPLASRSVDAVVAAQAFHWFDHDKALPEVARVLRPGGVLAIVWNLRDERIPWVRKLGDVIGDSERAVDPNQVIDQSGLFGTVERSSFRFWQPMTRQSLRDMVASRSNVALMTALDRDRVLRKADELYDDYGRGADGMLLPYVTRTFRTTVLLRTDADPQAAAAAEMDTDALLIDFR
jgi:SAM-dependent methyltransferase